MFNYYNITEFDDHFEVYMQLNGIPNMNVENELRRVKLNRDIL